MESLIVILNNKGCTESSDQASENKMNATGTNAEVQPKNEVIQEYDSNGREMYDRRGNRIVYEQENEEEGNFGD